ncbi:MAG: efflux RND transporter periplasmic adaptor subunit, partial [Candidatus Rokuibacteriota bacterium]
MSFTTVGAGYVDDGVELLGAVRPNGDRLAHITPRFAGIVREVRRNVGDRVRAGEVLAVLESSESLAPYQLTTLIDGVIIEKHLTRGEAVDRETQCFVIADLSSVWVDLAVYQKDVARVSLGQRVRVRAAESGPEGEGTISYLTPSLDEVTRTATARVELPNAEGQWRPGMFVAARALAEHEARLVVPTGALQTMNGRDVVFVADEHGVEP